MDPKIQKFVTKYRHLSCESSDFSQITPEDEGTIEREPTGGTVHSLMSEIWFAFTALAYATSPKRKHTNGRKAVDPF